LVIDAIANVTVKDMIMVIEDKITILIFVVGDIL